MSVEIAKFPSLSRSAEALGAQCDIGIAVSTSTAWKANSLRPSSVRSDQQLVVYREKSYDDSDSVASSISAYPIPNSQQQSVHGFAVVRNSLGPVEATTGPLPEPMNDLNLNQLTAETNAGDVSHNHSDIAAEECYGNRGNEVSATTERHGILPASNAKRYYKMRSIHKLKSVFCRYNSRSTWLCSKWWIKRKAVSVKRGGGGLTVSAFVVLNPDGTRHGQTIRCMLNKGYTGRPIIRVSKALELGWSFRVSFRPALREIESARGDIFRTLGEIHVRMQCCETKILVDKKLLVVNDEDFPVAEGMLGEEEISHKHRTCKH